MRARFGLVLGALSLAPGAFWLAACSGGSGDNNNPEGGTDGTVPADSGVDTGNGGMDSGGMDSGGMDSGNMMNCAKLDGGAACTQCCRAQHVMGRQVLLNAEHSCICTGNKCPSCANNYCAADGGNPSGQCNACGTATLNPDGGACFGPVAAACQQSADCTAYLGCLNGCP